VDRHRTGRGGGGRRRAAAAASVGVRTPQRGALKGVRGLSRREELNMRPAGT
jgi:hypothetical protein